VSARRAGLADIAQYYEDKVRAFGPTPLGVDWPNPRAMHDRLLQLLEIVDAGRQAFSINDLGCGWGAALHVIEQRYVDVDYFGIDIAPAMIATAQGRWAQRPRTRFAVRARCARAADFSIASGIFNVKLGHTRDAWERHVGETLLDLRAHSRSGFAVNFMLPTPATRGVPELYTTEPPTWVSFCEGMGAQYVQVARVPGLDEFTLQVR
jgi:hypothetical protein